jgi:fumarylacetoacetase
VIRPKGQRKPPDAEAPEYGPSRRLDYELELGIWVGRGNDLGQPIPVGEAATTSRAIACSTTGRRATCRRGSTSRSGPFLAKNFLTSVSPWIVSADALEPFRSPMPARPQGDPRRFRISTMVADRESGRAERPASGDSVDGADAQGRHGAVGAVARAAPMPR